MYGAEDLETRLENIDSLKSLIKKRSATAIIPARGGSKSIKNKNIKELNGTPLIAYSIKHALRSKLIEEIYVTSDSQKILEVAHKYNAKKILRPQELANDFIHPEPAIIHALIKIAKTKKFLPECTVFLQPTSPIRDISKLDQSILDVFSGKFNTSMAATKTHHFIWEKNQNGEWEPPYGNLRPRRQDFHQVKETGSFFSFNTLKFLEKGDRIIKPVNLQITSEIESYEIDTLVDWDIIEALVKSKSSK